MLSKSTLINRLLNRLLSSYDQCNQTNRSTSLPRADALSASSGPSVAGNRSNTNRILFAHLWTYILARCCIGGPFESTQHRHQTRPHHNHQYSSFSRRSHPLRCKVKKFLHRLSKSDLIRLWNVVDTNGSYVNDCILVHRTEQSSHYTLENNHKQRLRDQQRLSMCCNDIIDHEVCDDDDEDDITPQWFIIMLRNWYRYDDIVQRMLKPLPWCSHYHTLEYDRNNQQSMYCINPYHWSLYNCDSNYDGGGSSRPRRQQHKASCKPSPPPIVISPILEDNVTPLDDDDCQLIGHKEMVQQCQQQHNQYYPMPSSTPPPSYSEANKQGQLFSDEAQCDGHMSPKSKFDLIGDGADRFYRRRRRRQFRPKHTHLFKFCLICLNGDRHSTKWTVVVPHAPVIASHTKQRRRWRHLVTDLVPKRCRSMFARSFQSVQVGYVLTRPSSLATVARARSLFWKIGRRRSRRRALALSLPIYRRETEG
ncbi:hypothetical protein RDWZM_002673 [Blomia tropicalis]|uniref:Uncharacterized protein n=1 Tax=Blomia tropicalis TaxID=40697 RepID=A0A9Q0MFF1_BLOTA|nr:hypothetical protein RDWZM_002673 [Blomia tropicalis]